MPETRTENGIAAAGPPPAPALAPMPAALTRPDGAVVLAAREGFALWQVAALPGRDAAVAEALGRALGAPAPGPGRWVAGGGIAVLRLAPRRWWVLAAGRPGDDMNRAGDAAGCETPAPLALAPADGTVLDLGEARVGLEIAGAAAGALIARLLAVDLRAGAVPADTALTAPLHGVPVVVAAGSPLAASAARSGAAGGAGSGSGSGSGTGTGSGSSATVTLFLPRSQARSLAAMIVEAAEALSGAA